MFRFRHGFVIEMNEIQLISYYLIEVSGVRVSNIQAKK